MALKIGIINGKGGVGKSTTSMNIGCYTQHFGLKTCLIDTDPQGSIQDWRSLQEEHKSLPTVVGITKPIIHSDIPKIESAFDVIIIDGASKTEQIDSSIIKIVDVALIASTPSVLDIWGAEDICSLIKARQMVTDGQPKAACVVTMNKAGTTSSKEVTSALKQIGFDALPTRIPEKEVFVNAVAEGLPAFLYGRKEEREESLIVISSLWNDICSLAGLDSNLITCTKEKENANV